jgi:hypothetical protein
MTSEWNTPELAAPQAAYTTVSTGQPAKRTVDLAAVTAFVLSIVSFVVWIIPSVLGFFLASGAKRNIAASNGTRTGRGLAIAAQVMSVLTLVFTLVAAGVLLLF